MNAVATGLWAALTGGTALTALLAGTASVYNSVVPTGAAFGVVVFQQQGGGDDNETPHRSRSLLYLVKGISATSMQNAGNIDTQIDTLLHRKTLTVTGWTNYWTERETDVRYVETTPEGRNYWHAGGIYRVRIHT